MTDFDPADLDRAVEAVRSRLAEVPALLGQVRTATTVASRQLPLPSHVRDQILRVAGDVVADASRITDRIEELLEGYGAPIGFFVWAGAWVDVKGKATDVQGVLRTDQMPAAAHWKGVAADRYSKAVATQSSAAGRVAAAAHHASVVLGVCALAGLAFYVTLGVVLAQLIAALVAVVAALMSGVFSWAGLLGAAGEISITGAQVIAAVSTLSALLGTQAGALNMLHGEVVDHSQFPGGHWPGAVADTYADATVTDGDAKWSIA